MNVCIARDGAEIGEFPRDRLEELARTGELHPSDYYWHDGIENWSLLGDLLGAEAWQPAPAKPVHVPETIEQPAPVMEWEPARAAEPIVLPAWLRSSRFLSGAGICLGSLLVGGVAIYFLTSAYSDKSTAPLLLGSATPAPSAPPAPAINPDAVRDKASAELRGKLEKLPGRPVPPLHAFYYDVSVHMRKSLSARVPWSAVIRGGENVVDPATEKTTLHTDFILTLEYRDGEWTFQRYRASASDMIKAVTDEIDEGEDSRTPPSIVGMLGIKMKQPGNGIVESLNR